MVPLSFSFLRQRIPMTIRTETIVDTPSPVKMARNPVKKGDKPVAPVNEAAALPPVDMKIARQTVTSAKLSHLILDPAGHKAAQIEYWLPQDHTYEMLKSPAYWTGLVAMLKRHGGDFSGSVLHIRTFDHQFYAQLYVTDISLIGIQTVELSFARLGVQAGDVKSDKFRWIWNQPLGGYDIIRIADGQTVASAKEMKRLQSVKDWLEKWEV